MLFDSNKIDMYIHIYIKIRYGHANKSEIILFYTYLIICCFKPEYVIECYEKKVKGRMSSKDISIVADYIEYVGKKGACSKEELENDCVVKKLDDDDIVKKMDGVIKKNRRSLSYSIYKLKQNITRKNLCDI